MPNEQSLWTQLEDITKKLQHNRLADVFRVISFQPFERYEWHSHVRYEINFVKKGSCTLFVDDESVHFSENETMIISSNLFHAFEAGANGATLIQLEFLPEMFSRLDPKSSLKDLMPINIFSRENRLIKIVNNVRIMRSVQRIINELDSKKKFHQYLVLMYYAELLILIHRHLEEHFFPISSNDALVRAIGYLRENYQTEINITDVAAHANVSERYLRKLFEQFLNISPLDYLNQIRINKSMELLRNTELSVKEISFACGFKSPQYFSRVFKQQKGFTPKEITK